MCPWGVWEGMCAMLCAMGFALTPPPILTLEFPPLPGVSILASADNSNKLYISPSSGNRSRTSSIDMPQGRCVRECVCEGVCVCGVATHI